MRLEPLALWLPPAADPPLPRIREALARAGGPGSEPLRWAITGVDPVRGLHLEAVLLLPETGPR